MKNDQESFFYGTRDIALFFDVTTRQLTNWIKLGCPKEARGKYDLKAVHRWWLENIYGNKNQTDDANINQTKHEYWTHKARNEKVKADLAEGAVMPRADIISEWAKRVHEVSSGLDALSLRIAPLVVGKDEKDIERIISDEIWDLRDSYARTGTYSPKTD